MSAKTKNSPDESPKKLLGGLKEEEPKNEHYVEIRRDRIPELSEQTRDRLNEIFGNGIISPEVVQQENLPALGIEYKGDQELGGLALISTLGIDNSQYIREQTNALMNATASQKDGAKVMGERMSASLALIASIAPQDAIESMLASQMVATHWAVMKAQKELNHSETILQADSAMNRTTKLMRVYNQQMEALNKHRGKGQQKMTVEHVHVHEGAQAIVGNVEGGGGNAKK